MEETSLARKERLLALKQKAKRSADDIEKPQLRFRNYEPISSDLKEGVVAAPPIGPDAKESVPTVEGSMDQFAQEALQQELERKKEVVKNESQFIGFRKFSTQKTELGSQKRFG